MARIVGLGAGETRDLFLAVLLNSEAGGKSLSAPAGVFFSVNEAKNIFSAFVKHFEIMDKKCWISAKYFLIMFADKLIILGTNCLGVA